MTLIPKITVIMPVFNGEKTIKRSIMSLLDQTYANWELIVVNGYSTDGTKSIIEFFDDPRIRVLEFKKLGIYNAINIGVQHARGDWLMNLNCDDYLGDESFFEKYLKCITSKTQVLYSDVRVHSNDKTKLVSGKSRFDFFNTSTWGWLPPHPTYLVRASILKTHRFNETYKISGDYDWFIRLFSIHNVKFLYVPNTSVDFSIGGVSTTFGNLYLIFLEDLRVVTENLGRIYVFVPVLKRLRKISRKLWEIFCV